MIPFETIRKIEFFKDFSDEEMHSLHHMCRIEKYSAESFIFREGAGAENLYVLEKGRVSIEIEVTGGERISVFTLSHFAEPFGWSALVEPFVFTASARCVENSEVISIDGKKLISLIEKDFRAGFLIMKRVAKILSGRVRNTRLQLIHCFYG